MHDAETLIAAIHRNWGEAQGNYDELRRRRLRVIALVPIAFTTAGGIA